MNRSRPTGRRDADAPAVDAATPAPDGADEPVETVTEPAKVMRIGSMVKQLLEEVQAAPLDDASRERLAEIYERSIVELASALSPDLQDELRIAGPAVRGRRAPDRRRAAHRPGPAGRLARGAVPRHPGHAVRPAARRPPAARADAPAAAGRRPRCPAPTARPEPGPARTCDRARHVPLVGVAGRSGTVDRITARVSSHRVVAVTSRPWAIRSPTSTSTPSSRCSTGRRGSTSWWPRRSPTASRRSASPTTATCTASSTSTRSASKQGVKPIIGTEAYMAYDTGTSARPTRPHRRLRRRHRGRQEALLPPHPAGRERRGLPQPDPARRASPSSRATTTSRGSTGSCSSATTTG